MCIRDRQCFINVAIETKINYHVAIATVGKLAPPDLKHHRWRLYQLFLFLLQQLERKKVHKKFGQDLNRGAFERKPTALSLS